MWGLDVASGQLVNWSSARKTRHIGFAYIKATQGTYYINPSFGSQYVGAYKAGIIRGAYAFAIPGNSTATQQAKYLVAHGGRWSNDGKTLPAALDIEYNPYGSECYGFSQSGMRAWVSQWVDEYHALTKVWPTIYSTTDWWSTCTGNWSGPSKKDPLWIARYSRSAGALPAGYKVYTFWQYSSSGSIPGVSPVDLDRFNGPESQLVKLAKNG